MKHLLLILLTAITLNANAVVINETTSSYLDSVFLDYGQYHRDTTEGGLEWLNFSQLVNDGTDQITLQNSINVAEDWYGDQGWRLATSTEVYDLFDLFFPTYVSDAGENGKMVLDDFADPTADLIEARNSWMFAFGTDAIPLSGTDLNTDGSDLFSYGLYLDENGGVQFLGTYLGGGNDAQITSHIYGTDHDITGLTRNSAFKNAGVFVVRDYTPEVPIPAAIWLFGSGLIGLITIARRKYK